METIINQIFNNDNVEAPAKQHIVLIEAVSDATSNKNIELLNSNNSVIVKNLLKILETYNYLHDEYKKEVETDVEVNEEIKNNTKFNNTIEKSNKSISEQDLLKFSGFGYYDTTINIISNIILDNQYEEAYKYIKILQTKIYNNLVRNILSNSPDPNSIVYDTFYNIKTKLYPYQINNLNWMLNIEKKIYSEEYEKIKNEILFKGGGLFDEVGMGKTLQIITLVNSNKAINNSFVKNNILFTKATLIIAPNYLCGQWLREFNLHTTKPLNIISLLTKVHYKKYTYYDYINCDVVIVSANFFKNCNLNQHDKVDPLYNIINIFNTEVNIFTMYWHRVVIDEYHEIEDSNLFNKVKYINTDFRWIISGTPFKENSITEYTNLSKTSLSQIIDYLTMSANVIKKIDFTDLIYYNYIKSHFSRNMHMNNMKILCLPEIIEETVWLSFTDVERAIYNAYVADPNNSKSDIFLRQLCCHPLISNKIRENVTNKIETLDEMKNHIKKMYFKEYDIAEENYNECKERIDRIKLSMKNMENECKTNLITYKNYKDDLEVAETKIVELLNIKNGKEKTVIYYKNFLELISDADKVKTQECPICLDTIKESDMGITTCGHIFCYTCISMIINESHNKAPCPNCKKSLDNSTIFMLNSTPLVDNNLLGTKLTYIINYMKQTPNKYRIIFSQWDYLLKEVGKVLETNGVKHLYCQGNAYQKDKVLRLFNSTDTQNNEYKIIMLSSDSTVSGSNLSNAEEVVFLDPVYGNKQYRVNTENQAIGRVRRLGNKFKNIKVLRILIKDSVEEEIYKSNNSIS
jgi:hypothetical protein